jgi:hypothetical protein
MHLLLRYVVIIRLRLMITMTCSWMIFERFVKVFICCYLSECRWVLYCIRLFLYLWLNFHFIFSRRVQQFQAPNLMLWIFSK